ncbi:flagellar biosynthetic protein FliR [Methylogaea oryzae]|uniref:flagellar biosynthetic protein FliR n=1 Tax=Methylogaea oryzae TaxID=1295382 RepID=UPI0006D0A47D|nr:flagellar biosynthetic protein FliR [Methylogaea oryzae]
MHYSEAQMLEWVGRFMWPLLRVGSLFISLPVFTSHGVPARARLILAVVISLALAPAVPTPPAIALFSLEGFATVAQQLFIGVLTGYILQLVYATTVYGGNIVSLSMGLGFASLIDPQTGVQVPVVAQIYLILTTLIFLGTDGHLLLIEMLADSFQTIPVGVDGIGLPALKALLAWSSLVFSGGILMALPIMSVLLFITIGMGVATRAAPQLSIFSVGFPLTIGAGLFLLWSLIPEAVQNAARLLREAYGLVRSFLLV